MHERSICVDAIFENGVLRPIDPLPLQPQQRVTITVQFGEAAVEWPSNVAEIYREIAADDRRIAEQMLPTIQETWPAGDFQKIEDFC